MASVFLGVVAANDTLSLIEALLEFIENLMNGQHRYEPIVQDFKLLDHEWYWLQDNFVAPHALGFLIMLMRITDDQIRLWNNNVDDFINQNERGMDGIGRTAENLLVVSTTVSRGKNMQLKLNLHRRLSPATEKEESPTV